MSTDRLLNELEETAAWIEERASFLRELAAKKSSVSKQISVEAAKFEGRATVIRQVLHEQTAAPEQTCEGCRVVIPSERLEAIPGTTLCVRCARKAQQGDA